MKFEVYPLGDGAITICFGNEIAPEINDNVLKAAETLEALDLPGLFELVPTYCTLMVHYNRELYSFAEISKKIKEVLGKISGEGGAFKGRLMEIPVCYGGEKGPDIGNVAEHGKLTEKEVIRIHTEPEYRVYMLGFLAGFPYLGGLDSRLETPRLESPRTKIEPGSVGIAGKQTGAYSIASPGGWQLIGRTPLKLYDKDREEPALLRAGDRVKFREIDAAEYERLSAEAANSGTMEAQKKAVEKNAGTDKLDGDNEEKGATPTFTIQNPGLLTTIQDQGRTGYRSMGVSVSGAMDKASAALANMILGNSYKEAVLECMMLGPSLEFKKATKIAIAGARTTPKLNGVPVAEYMELEVKAGDILSFGPITQGMFFYIAFAGGIDVPEELGSRSTHMRTNMGGLEGRKLAKGDSICVRTDLLNSASKKEASGARVVAINGGNFRPIWRKEITLRVIPDRFEERFTKEGVNTFYGSEYTVSNSCDRMGYRLEGNAVEHKNGADIITDGVIMGSVQIPPNGQPIIMMADCQTTGGYTRIGNIISEDLSKLAQCGPGCKVRFTKFEITKADLAL